MRALQWLRVRLALRPDGGWRLNLSIVLLAFVLGAMHFIALAMVLDGNYSIPAYCLAFLWLLLFTPPFWYALQNEWRNR